MLTRVFIVVLLTISMLFVSCNSENNEDTSSTKKNIDVNAQKESLIKVNKYLVKTENTEIANYIKRHNLTVVETGSGLKYQIVKSGKGEKAVLGKIVSLNYKVKLITGDVIYSSNKSGPLHYQIGRGGVESGLEEAIMNMRVGDEAIIIIPSHLAHGLLGDDKKIPARSTVIYEIEFTNLINK